jgi:hypothetical protein
MDPDLNWAADPDPDKNIVPEKEILQIGIIRMPEELVRINTASLIIFTEVD